MADLAAALADVSLGEIRTYIQSGNICFVSSESCLKLENLIRDTIADRFGFEVPVLVREQKYFQKLISQSPFYDAGTVSYTHLTLPTIYSV